LIVIKYILLVITFILNFNIQGFANESNLTESALRGLEISQQHCSRCHIVSDKNRYSSIETTPSFFGLRAMRDWKLRFSEFFVRPPHPALVNIAYVTERSKKLPAFVTEIDLTLDQIDDLVAYVEQLERK
jgi:hypothetical protein